MLQQLLVNSIKYLNTGNENKSCYLNDNTEEIQVPKGLFDLVCPDYGKGVRLPWSNYRSFPTDSLISILLVNL